MDAFAEAHIGRMSSARLVFIEGDDLSFCSLQHLLKVIEVVWSATSPDHEHGLVKSNCRHHRLVIVG